MQQQIDLPAVTGRETSLKTFNGAEAECYTSACNPQKIHCGPEHLRFSWNRGLTDVPPLL